MRGHQPIVPERLRRVPPQFSWVDHRLVREGRIRGLSAYALALYLFLVTVADAEGLSWYSEAGLCRSLSWSEQELCRARAELEAADLIAYRPPLYQVLDLAPAAVVGERSRELRTPAAVSLGDVLRGMLTPAREPTTPGGGGR